MDTLHAQIDDIYDSEDMMDEIESCFGRTLKPIERKYVTDTRPIDGVDSDYLVECTSGVMTPEAVADKLRQVYGSNALPTRSSVDSVVNRSAVNSQLIALDAKGREEVVAFREVVMKNNFITTDKTEKWIKRYAKKDGKPTPPKELKYKLLDQDRISSVYVTSGGILDNLRVLSIKLSWAFGWTQAQSMGH